MRAWKPLAILIGLSGLAACADPNPPMSGASPGMAASPLHQRVAEQPHSDAVSGGPAEIAGARGDGHPEISRSGLGTGTLGGVPPTPQQRARPN